MLRLNQVTPGPEHVVESPVGVNGQTRHILRTCRWQGTSEARDSDPIPTGVMVSWNYLAEHAEAWEVVGIEHGTTIPFD